MDELCTYQLEIGGRAGENDLNATSPLQMMVRVGAESTLLTVSTDQSGLIGLLRHLHGRGLVLLSVRGEEIINKRRNEMSQPTQSSMADEDAVNVHWKGLYRIGGVAALVATVLFLSDIIVMLAGVPMPGSASDWFTHMQDNKVVGILELFFTDLVGLVLLIPFILSLYSILRRVNAGYATLATTVAFVGIGVVFATNSNYSMIYLSHQYSAATTEVQRSQILAAGEALYATGLWGTGVYIAGALFEGAMVAFSIFMLRSGIFKKGIAWLGILGHGLDFLHSIALLVFTPVFSPALASAIGVPLLAVGGSFQLIWYPLVARRLIQLGRVEGK